MKGLFVRTNNIKSTNNAGFIRPLFCIQSKGSCEFRPNKLFEFGLHKKILAHNNKLAYTINVIFFDNLKTYIIFYVVNDQNNSINPFYCQETVQELKFVKQRVQAFQSNFRVS